MDFQSNKIQILQYFHGVMQLVLKPWWILDLTVEKLVRSWRRLEVILDVFTIEKF